MSRLNAAVAALSLAGPLMLLTPVQSAAQGAKEILEQARGQAREIEELRKVLNSPDQNMRLAVFDQMVKSGDEAMKLIAYEAGLASADSVMRAMAFKAVLMSQDNLHLTLAVDRSAPKPIQEDSEKYLAKTGNGLVLPLGTRNIDAGTFRAGNWEGQVNGTDLVFNYGNSHAGRLGLDGDNALAGVVRLNRGSTQFEARSKLR